MKKILLLLSIFCFFFACKKDNTNTPSVLGKEIEISGQVLEFGTNLPMEGVAIYIVRSTHKKLSVNPNNPDPFFTDKDGKYNFKLNVLDSTEYSISAHKKSYTEIYAQSKCTGCMPLIKFWNKEDFFHLKHTFFLTPASYIKFSFNLKNAKLNDTLLVREYQNFENFVSTSPRFPLWLNFKGGYGNNDTIISRDHLADKMSYLSWKLKSEKDWHQDSIMTPFGKTVNFNIKY